MFMLVDCVYYKEELVELRFCSIHFTAILVQAQKKVFVLRTSLYRGSLYRGSTTPADNKINLIVRRLDVTKSVLVLYRLSQLSTVNK